TVVNRHYQWRIMVQNLAGPSPWATFSPFQTRPAEPSNVVTKAAPGGAVQVSWKNNVSYSATTTRLRYYKDGVLVTDAISLASGETSYTLTDVELTSTYKFGVRAESTVGYNSQSLWVDGADTAAATVPN